MTTPWRAVYVIGFNSQPVKIGIAFNVASRLAELQVGSPYDLESYHTSRVPALIAAKVERLCHEHFAENRMRGEWFDVPAARAAIAVELIARREIEAMQQRPSGKEEFLDGLDRRHSVSRLAPAASQRYRALLLEPDGNAEIESMNRAVLDTAGLAGLEVLKSVVVRRQSLRVVFLRDPAKFQLAEAKLAEAVNALAAHFAAQRRYRVPDLRRKPTAANDRVDQSVGNAA